MRLLKTDEDEVNDVDIAMAKIVHELLYQLCLF